jgi:GTP-binding protein YchF
VALGFICGIIGLPNAGKSTIFNAFSAAKAEVASYPFCTIQPNQGIVAVPDDRLQTLARILKPSKVTPTVLEFRDIAGLVKGASKGEGLGNQFLGHIRNVDALAHVVRCFEDENVSHVYGFLDPQRDVEIVETELILADLQTVEKRLAKAAHQAKVGEKKSSLEVPYLQEVYSRLSRGLLPAGLAFPEEGERVCQSLELLTRKPVLYVANVDEKELEERRWTSRVETLAARGKSPVVVICGRLEAEIAELSPAERGEFLQEMGLAESALNQLIRAGYALLQLITFYTTVGPELRAWTVPRGTPTPRAAGKIHTDMERGFIRAEVISFAEFMAAGSMALAKEKGMVRAEGKDYIVRDGDILYIRFHV